jgi:hypothetical protein
MSKSNDLTAAIITHMNYSGFFVWRNNTVGIYDPVKKVFRKKRSQLNGISDIIGFRKKDGKFVGIEIKIGYDKMSDEQIYFQEQVLLGNGLFFIAKDFDSYLNWVKNEQ